MKIRKDLLSSIGLNEYAPVRSLVLVIMFLAGIGIFADGIMDLVDAIKIPKIILALLIFAIVYLAYQIIGQKELAIIEKKSANREKMIMFYPSNLDLLQKIIRPHNIKRIYFIKTEDFPSPTVEKEIDNKLSELTIDTKKFYIENKDNAKQIKDVFFKIYNQETISNEAIVNITTGNTVTSLVLNECADFLKLDVEYMTSEYDHNNKTIENTEKNIIIDFKSEFKS